jgi:membrane protein
MTLGKLGGLLRDTFLAYVEGDIAMMGAAIAFYTMLALAPLMLIIVALAAPVFGAADARMEIVRRIRAGAGPDVAGLVAGVIEHLHERPLSAWHIAIAGFFVFYLTTRLFTQTQAALNHLWQVPMPAQTGLATLLRAFGLHRLYATLMVLAIGLLTVLLMLVPAVEATLRRWIGFRFHGDDLVSTLVQWGVTAVLLTLFIGAIYRLLPNARIRWKDALVGGAATAVLLAASQALIGLYFAHDSPGAPYGAGGAMFVLLLWLYYSGQVFFIGAQLTALYARRFGSGVQPLQAHKAEM